jgi:hypothetical protein
MLTDEARPFASELARFRECALRQRTVDRLLANRIVHKRFWHETAWL